MYDIVNLQKTEIKERKSTKPTSQTAVSRKGTLPNENIMLQNKGNVNTQFSMRIDSDGRELSEAQQEFFKDSKVRDEEGRLLTVYHGSDKEIFVFDRTKARANMDIQGSFFSPWEIDAQGYGGKVGEYYLNIVNPASEAMGYKALKKFQSKDGLKHSLDRRLKLNAPVVLKAGEILQNSIKINELTPQKAEAETSYVLIGASKNNSGDFYIVRSVVNKFSNELTEMDVLYAINAKKENQLRSMRPGFLHPVTGSIISISDFLDYVNEYFPDVLPESVLRHYGHTERPVGKLGENALYQLRIEDKNRLDILDRQETRLTADLKTLERAYAEAIRAEYERSIKPSEETSRRAAEINRKAAKRKPTEQKREPPAVVLFFICSVRECS